MEPEPLQKPDACPSASEHHVAKFVLAILAMVLIMGWSVYYKGPSGQSFDAKGFIFFWLRELIILIFVVIALVIGGIRWVRRRIQNHRGGNHAL
jgi:polyferredoxin